MSFEVNPPKFDVEKKSYTFTFNNAPRIEEITTDLTKLHVSQDTLYEVFVKEFLEKASKHFSKKLEHTIFFKRLEYKWITEEVEHQGFFKEGEQIRAIWLPVQVIFYTSRYEIYFSLVEVKSAAIASTNLPGFLEAVEEVNEIIQETELPELPIAEVSQEVIPFGEISNEEKTKREIARKRIRQARLRATLAKLRAEKLADRYYNRYGNFDMDSSESELSSEED